MKIKLPVHICICLLCAMLSVLPAQAKRPAPAEVAPVVMNGIQYVVPHWGYSRDRANNGGYVEAWDLKTKKQLWSIQVYDTQYDSNLESDVQDVFITSLSVSGQTLQVVNEAGDIYSVNLITKDVIHNNADNPASLEKAKKWWQFWK